MGPPPSRRGVISAIGDTTIWEGGGSLVISGTPPSGRGGGVSSNIGDTTIWEGGGGVSSNIGDTTIWEGGGVNSTIGDTTIWEGGSLVLLGTPPSKRGGQGHSLDKNCIIKLEEYSPTL